MSLAGRLGGAGSFGSIPWQACLSILLGGLSISTVFLFLDHFSLFLFILKILKTIMRTVLRTLRSPLLLHTYPTFSLSSPFQASSKKWTFFLHLESFLLIVVSF